MRQKNDTDNLTFGPWYLLIVHNKFYKISCYFFKYSPIACYSYSIGGGQVKNSSRKPNPSDSQEMMMALELSILARQGWAYVSQQLGNSKISGVLYHILTYLSNHPNASQDDLTHALSMDKSSIAKITAKAVEDGYIKRVRSKTDKRRYELNLTAKGKNAVARIKPMLARWQKNLLNNMTRAEQKQFLSSLTEMGEISDALMRKN